ncbi:protein disulfide isomerase, DsbG family [Campylobacter blaseri]|uniref:Thioredoxin-like fold domain-containing protein n=1 Tax=Campylobacter blaseri TaxID=2042961 RepID=A0A2P8R429_9BACT|nr:thioredoxin fold domain-containing protein [Campylobacter blaseri]PSM53256.1 hypothetical protein CQ405_01560 [Campylobacter blaseri]PSM54722.1 hypothetical protein CRN67_01560 [Campylobacter blaseri]QKF86795.1 protein disulfide isomerase, DsbG family [Campylobacter blaseri]
MKKILLTSALSLSAVFAATDAEILSLYQGMPHEIKMKIVERVPVKDFDGVEMVIIEMSQGDMRRKEVIFSKGDFVIPDLLNLKTQESYKAKYLDSLLIEKLAELYSKEDKANIIKIGNDNSKPTLIMLSDTDCPYCRREVANINEILKENNLEIIMTSIHGAKAHAKSVKVYEEMKNAKSDEEKIKVLNKWYAQDAKSPEVSEADVKKMEALANKYFSAGVQGVPYIVEKSKLVK